LTVIVSAPQAAGVTTATITCPATNPIILGGGYSNIDANAAGNAQFTIDSYPSASNQWKVTTNDVTSFAWAIWAICGK
jgi:hypothetical protein